MANSLTSNTTRKLMRSFLKAFESNRVVTKTVNTQLFQGKFTPASGSTVDIKRPHDYTSIRTSGGDISSSTKDSITSGKATATVQDYFTASVDWDNVEEALELDQLDDILAPMARRIVTDLEVDFASFMFKNSGMVQGTPGTAVASWSDVANAGALMSSTGIPSDSPWYYLINPFTQVALADLQNSLSASDSIVRTAWEKAQISRNFGGLSALTSQSLGSYTTPTTTDLAGAVNGVPTATYAAHKDTMIQTIVVDGFTDSVTVVAGTVVEIPTRFILNQATREPALDAAGANIPWRGVVQADAVMTGGAATLTVSSPAIKETTGSRDSAYDTVVAAIADNDVINILNASATTFQPNLFYHPQAFSMASVKLPKLYSTDTTVTTEDGFSLRVSKYADGDANTQKCRFDLLPAYATLNPFFAGQGWG
ncbi:MAG: P22 phage major capsid protein family protein [Rhodospirillales bacterium]